MATATFCVQWGWHALVLCECMSLILSIKTVQLCIMFILWQHHFTVHCMSYLKFSFWHPVPFRAALLNLSLSFWICHKYSTSWFHLENAFSCSVLSQSSTAKIEKHAYEWDLHFFLPFVEIAPHFLLFLTLMDIIIFNIDKIMVGIFFMQHPQTTRVIPFYFHIGIISKQAVDFA